MSPRLGWTQSKMALGKEDTLSDTHTLKVIRPSNSACPLHVLTAYWTTPPLWPRRLLCENKSFSFSLSRGCWVTLSVTALTYFAIMDVFLFARYRVTDLAQDSKAGHPGEKYSPFTHLSVKAVLSDHVRHYVMTPSAEYFNALTGFSSVFTMVTPNVISFVHLVCAFIAGKFISSDKLHDRQLGVLIYFFRTWLDSFDGTVFRSREGVHLQYNSVYSSMGYVIDGLFDTLGGCFLTAGIIFYLYKTCSPNKYTSTLPVYCHEKAACDGMTSGHTVVSKLDCSSYRHLIVQIFGLGLCLAVTGICWDRAVKDFTEVFQTELTSKELSSLQFELSHEPSTLVIFFFWRFLSGQTVITYTQVAIYMDKVLEFLHYIPWVILTVTVPLYVITVIHVQQIKDQLLL
ncbi:ceramide phosphoethanolamine synthase-like [Biomphalaria glabrata]|uniref:Ceramide phosphoethanolamine synthase-like n=1 Tax=Biomphalaria glabrata TaxID=6526 RepID=A0A9W3B894_BIOGL|nr:ceramide phosphoethanolamine synthase-like [Biomphalaria glabrata]